MDSFVIRHKLQYVISIYKRKIYNSYTSICSFFFSLYTCLTFLKLFLSLCYRFAKLPHIRHIAVYWTKSYTQDLFNVPHQTIECRSLMWSKQSQIIILNTREMIFLKAYGFWILLLHVEGERECSFHLYTLGGVPIPLSYFEVGPWFRGRRPTFTICRFS